MDISTFANVLNAVALTAGVLFAVVQIRDYRRHRNRESMLSVVRSFQNPLFAKALRSVIELPDNATVEQVKEIVGEEGEDLLAHLTATWETIGVMLYHGELTIDIVDDFFSGPIVLSWRKLGNYLTALRAQYQRDTWFEWFQWLAERMLERETLGPPVPAHVAHAPGTKSYERWSRGK